jgi:hypothetical protein
LIRIEAEISPFGETIRKIDKVPGINLDMTRFPTAGHLVS